MFSISYLVFSVNYLVCLLLATCIIITNNDTDQSACLVFWDLLFTKTTLIQATMNYRKLLKYAPLFAYYFEAEVGRGVFA